MNARDLTKTYNSDDLALAMDNLYHSLMKREVFTSIQSIEFVKAYFYGGLG